MSSFYNFNGAMEQNVLKLLEALIDHRLSNPLHLSEPKAGELPVIY